MLNFVFHNSNMSIRLLILVAGIILCAGCKDGAGEQKEGKTEKGTYFSIAEYAEDQWSQHLGQGYGMVKIVDFNGKVDSVFTNAIELDWAPILKTFFETDISDEKFLDRYNFSSFKDETTHTVNFYYEAKEKGLYTRKLHISAKEDSYKITSIYIEAKKDNRLGTKDIKLLYTPLETISIQELETSKTGKRKELRVVYKFL